MAILSVLLLFIATFLQLANSIRVMGIFTQPLQSHYMAFKPLFEELAKREHQVTVIGNFPNPAPVKNFKDVNISSTKEKPYRDKPLTFYDDLPKSLHNAYNFYRHVTVTPEMVIGDCENLFTNIEVKNLIESKVKFDVIFVEQFLSDCALPFAEIFYEGVPIIGIASHVLTPWAYKRIGLPFRLSSDAFYFSPGGHAPTILQKLESTIFKCYFNIIARWQTQSNIKRVVDKYFPNIDLDIEELASNIRMIFSYQYFSLTGSRLLAPHILEIGGLHIRQSKALPTKIEDFIDNSPNGVIYVSFGSMLKPSTMSVAKIKAFISVFESIPQRILWKFDNITVLAGLHSDKVMTQAWFPQLDILCHRNVIGFVSHGGMLGTSEAASCGVPVVVIPFFGDQFANSASIRESGLGVSLFFQDLTEETLLRALADITAEKRRTHAQLLAKLWHDRPQTPMDSAIFWTEYVARHPNISPPQPASKRVTPFEDLLLDVYLLLAVLVLTSVGAVYGVLMLLKLLIWKLARTVMCKSKVE